MRSSRGFASTAPNLFALIRLAFASASPQSGLTLLVTVSRRIIMQKARHHSSVAVSYQLSAFSQNNAWLTLTVDGLLSRHRLQLSARQSLADS
jgi:hypothetical protein